VHLISREQYPTENGLPPPAMPPVQYTNVGPPWFDYYATDHRALDGAQTLAGLDSIAVTKPKKVTDYWLITNP
jgi:hypothetical protein